MPGGPNPRPPRPGATQAPTPKAAVSRLPAPIPAKLHTPAQPVALKSPSDRWPQNLRRRRQPRSRPGLSRRPGSRLPFDPARASPAARLTPTPTPVAAVAPVAAPSPAEKHTPAQPVAPKEPARQVAAKPVAPTSPGGPQPRRQAPAGPRRRQAAGARPPGGAPPGPAPLTAAELVDTAIEVRNGTRAKNLAHQTRSLLRGEGFTVARIGNHVDFGAAKTMIYYRPGAERVAQAVGRTVFPGAELAPSLKLKKGMDIKVLLGHDLLENPQFMARLNGGAAAAAPFSATPPATDKLMAAKTEAERPAAGHQEPLEGEPGQGRAGAAALTAQVQGSCGPAPPSRANPPDLRRTGGHGHRGQERHLDQKSGPSDPLPAPPGRVHRGHDRQSRGFRRRQDHNLLSARGGKSRPGGGPHGFPGSRTGTKP